MTRLIEDLKPLTVAVLMVAAFFLALIVWGHLTSSSQAEPEPTSDTWIFDDYETEGGALTHPSQATKQVTRGGENE